MKKVFYLIGMVTIVSFLFTACEKQTDVAEPQGESIMKGAPCNIFVPGDYATIQEAVDAATDGCSIFVSAGEYEEQVVVSSKSILLYGEEGATIKSPASLTYKIGTNNYPIVAVENSTLIFDGFTVDGAGRGNTNYRFYGVYYYNSEGTINNCVIKDVRNEPINGSQHGNGIYAYNNSDDMVNLVISNNSVEGFQKNGITINGNWLFDYWSSDPQIATYSNIYVDIKSNTITGPGPIEVIAQNGIQMGRGASGFVKSNMISDLSYTPSGWASTGILDYYAFETMYQGNEIFDCDPALYIAAGNSTKVMNNDFTEDPSVPEPWALLLSGKDIKIVNNDFTNFYLGIYVGSGYYGETTNTKLINNTFNNVDVPIYYYDESGGVKEHATKVYNE